MGWLKDKLRRGSQAQPMPRIGASEPDMGLSVSLNQGGVCDVCNADLDVGAGYWVSTRTVVLSELYWERAFELVKGPADVLGLDDASRLSMFARSVQQKAADATAWAICEECSALFFFDRDEGRSHAVHRTQPGDCGPVDPAGFVLFAALGWERVYGRWPEVVERTAVTGTCDFCEKKMYEGELDFFFPTATLERYRADGFDYDEPVRPSRRRGDGIGWIACQPCLARHAAKAHRADYRPGLGKP